MYKPRQETIQGRTLIETFPTGTWELRVEPEVISTMWIYSCSLHCLGSGKTLFFKEVLEFCFIYLFGIGVLVRP